MKLVFGKAVKTLFILLMLSIGIYAVILSFIVDWIYLETYSFDFNILNEEGEALSNVDVAIYCYDKRGECKGEYDVKVANNKYIVEYHYFVMTAAIYSFFPKEKPLYFSISLEKNGYAKQSIKFSREELYDQYLVEAITDEESNQDFFYFSLPAFTLKTI